MRIKLQALNCHIHGFLIFLGMTAFLSCMIFPDNYMFYFLHSFILIVPFAITAWGEKKINHLASYIFAGIICCAFMFLLGGHFFEKLYLTVISLLIMLVRIPPRLNKSDDYEIVDENIHETNGILDAPGASFLFFFVFVFFMSMLLEKPEAQNIIYWLTFAYVANLLMFINLKSLNSYLYSRRNIANLPGQQIISTNRVLMLIFSLFTIALMLILPLIPMDEFISSIGIALRDFLRWFFSHFSSKQDPIIETVAEAISSSSEPAMMGETKPTPAWLKLILDVTFFIFAFAACIGLIAGLFYLILVIAHRFYKPTSATGDLSEFINEETETSFIHESYKKPKDNLFSQMFHPNTFVRKRFRKQIQKGITSLKKSVSSSLQPLTPSELEAYAGLSDDEYTKLLHELYEKARYSKEGCTKEDAARLKK